MSKIAIAAAGAVLLSSHAQAVIVNQWVQYAPNDTALIRAIEDTPSNGCPVATLDGVAVPLAPRGDQPTAAQQPQTYYPVLMCEASVPAFGHVSAVVGNVTLKMPVANPQRILIIGDTGCRVTAAVSGTQNCNDPTQFPLQYLANYAATFKPDLIVHVGDFFYREQPCPTGFSGCAGNPAFDNWDSWNADWFTPAANLLAAAPLAISRGNHESCNRGAHGWFRLLDVHAYDPNAVNCVGPYAPMVGAPGSKTSYVTAFDYTDPWLVHAGPSTLVMFDSSDSNTTAPDMATLSNNANVPATDPNYAAFQAGNGRTLPQIYAAQLGAVLPGLANTNVIYVTHKATYDIRPAKVNGNLAGGDATQQSVFDSLTPGGVPGQIKLLVSGHDHQFQVVDFANPNYAPMLVVGNSGTLLDNNTGAQPQTFAPDAAGRNANAGYALPGVAGTPTITVQATSDQSAYGFTVLDQTAAGYLVNVYNLSSSKLARCAIAFSPRSMLCSQ